ncbi:unnamed protein product [Rotaria sordida]|uniref:Fibronectin type-III domain-containing protein n=1 Tax=Rotaria sordida TaxID=392033 RepID=A0A813N778_9BILA|nr:unnamed protein product [Rotaria sordida]
MNFRKLLVFAACILSLSLHAQITIPNTTPVTEAFAIGTTATAALPSGWKMSVAGATSPTWAAGGNFTAVNIAGSSGAPATGGRYNWGNNTSTERAIGFMTSGGYASPNSIMAQYQNTNASNLTSLTVSYDMERYRVNSAAASIQFYYSTDGSTWTAATAGDIAAASLPTGTSAYFFAPVGAPSAVNGGVMNVVNISITGLNIATNGFVYLRWNINTTGANSQGIAIDNVSVTAAFTVPTTITTGVVSTSPFCVGPTNTTATGTVAYTTSGSFTGTFTAKLIGSDGTTVVNSNIGTGASPISIIIPAGTTPGTYYVRVDNNTPSTIGSNSSAITVNSLNIATSVGAVAGNGQATISWVNPAGATTCFDDIIIVRHIATIAGPPAAVVYNATDAFPNGGTVVYRGSTSSQTFSGLTNGTQYYFRVYARRGTDYLTVPANEVTVTPNATSITAPTAPSNICNFSTNTTGTATVTVAGTYTSNSFIVELSDNTGSFASPAQIGLVNDDTPGVKNISYSIPANTLPYATTNYQIRVSATSPVTNSPASSVFSINPITDVTAQSATAGPGAGQATLQWTNTACQTDVVIVASLSPITGTANPWPFAPTIGGSLDGLSGGAVFYIGSSSPTTISGLPSGSQIYFRIFTHDYYPGSGGMHFYSAAATSLTATPFNTITTPTALGSTCAVGSNATGNITVTTAGTFNAGNNFTAELSDASGNFPGTTIGTLSSTTTGSVTVPYTINSNTFAPSSAYKIRVNASNPSTQSTASSAFSINTLVDVTGQSATAGNAQNTIQWTNASCQSDVVIVQSTSAITGTPSGTPVVGNALTGLSSGIVKYIGSASPQTITGLTNGTAYNYRIYTRIVIGGTSYYSTGATLLTATPVAPIAPPFVVINKVYNNNSADELELLVINNNSDLRGLIFKDYSGSGGTDGGGTYVLSNDAVWNNIPAGTLINITSGSTAADINSSDFTLQIGMGNGTYFTNTFGAFNIAGDEIVMLKSAGSGSGSANGNAGAICSFAMGSANAQSNFTGAPGYKLSTNGTQIGTVAYAYANNATSTLADFNGTGATVVTSGQTFLQPNNSTNSVYICGLRGGNTQPTAVATGINFTAIGTNGMTVNWSNPVSGGGARRIVVARLAATTAVVPTDGVGYTASTVFSSPGAPNGTTGTGNVVVYDGTGTSVIVTGLANSSNYTFDIYEYNGVDFCANYYATAASASQATVSIVTGATVSGAPFCLNGSAGSGSVTYTPSGSFIGTFTAKLIASDGTTVVNANIGTGASPITISIPAGTASGTYYVRVDNTNPAVNGTLSSSFVINQKPTLAVGGVTTAGVCAGSSATISLSGLVNSSTSTVSYTVNGGSTQTVSVTANGSGAGSFTIASPVNSQPVVVTRITSSTDATCFTNFTESTNLVVNAIPTLTGTAASSTPVCTGATATITLSGLLGSTPHTVAYTLGGGGGSSPVTLAAGVNTFTVPLTVANSGLTITINTVTRTDVTPNCALTPSSGNTATLPTVNPSVAQPAVITGTDPICEFASGSNTTAYSSSTTVGTLFWSISPAAAGAINSGTGLVSWNNNWNGTATITVVSTGCNGPSTPRTRSVVLNPLPVPVATNTGPYCAGSTIQLNASPNGMSSYLWTGPNGYTNSSINTTTYTQNFNTLVSSSSSAWTNNSTIAGWYSINDPAAVITTITAGSGGTSAGDRYSFGTGASTDRALGSTGSGGTDNFAHGFRYQNTTGSTITSITITYTLEQWRCGANPALAQNVIFSYKTSPSTINNLLAVGNAADAQSQTYQTGTGWTGVTALTTTSPQNSIGGGSGLALDGNLAANRVTVTATISVSLPVNNYIMFKWEDPDHSGNDHGLGIDDVTIDFISGVQPQNPTIANATTAMAGVYTVVETSAAGCSASSTTTVQIGATEPTVVATGLNFTNITNTGMTLNWTNPGVGGGSRRVVVARQTSTTAVAPTDGTVYNASTVFSSPNGVNGTTGTGNVIVYSGTGTSVAVTGLTTGTSYTFDVYEFNEISGLCPNYYATPASAASFTGPTKVQFVSASATVSEGVGTYNIVVSIIAPSSTVATTGQVDFLSGSSSGQAADINNYTNQAFTFPAGTSGNQTITLTIVDDALIEATETFVFDLVNVTGGNGAIEGTPNQFTLSITDNDASGTIIYSTATGNGASDPIWSYNPAGPGQTIATLVAGGFDGTAAKDFVIQTGHTVAFPNGILYNMHDLTVQTGAKAWRGTFSSLTYSFINLFGNAVVNGSLGNNAAAGDGLGINFAGTSCTVSGTGVVNLSRIKKPGASDLPASNPTAVATTVATFNMNANLWHVGGANIHNEAANSTNFNFTVAAGRTVTVQSATGSVAIDGINGQGSGNSGGTYTINGTLTVNGTLIASNNNTAGTSAITVGATGVINAYDTDLNLALGNGTAFTFSTGGKLNVINALNLISGTITSASNIVIKSNATRTGYVDDFTAGQTGSISGNIVVERYITSGPNGFRYIGAPVNNGGGVMNLSSMSGFTISGNPGQIIPLSGCPANPANVAPNSPYGTFMYWQEAGPYGAPACRLRGWWFQVSGSMALGRGYGAKLSGGNTVTYTGAANTGNSPAYTCTHTNVFSTALNGWNLVSNTYPSAITIDNTDVPSNNDMPAGFDGQIHVSLAQPPDPPPPPLVAPITGAAIAIVILGCVGYGVYTIYKKNSKKVKTA